MPNFKYSLREQPRSFQLWTQCYDRAKQMVFSHKGDFWAEKIKKSKRINELLSSSVALILFVKHCAELNIPPTAMSSIVDKIRPKFPENENYFQEVDELIKIIAEDLSKGCASS